MRTHRNNIARYRRLLKTKLSDLERQFIERRLSEEQLDFERLAESAFPISFNVPPTATEHRRLTRPREQLLSQYARQA